METQISVQGTNVLPTFLLFPDSQGNQSKYTIVQYLFKGEKSVVNGILPLGNSKQQKPYYRVLPRTRKALKGELK